ncbi:hypothetical protein [Chroococcidiopsis sp. SAG 2025]|uniref:hypothetical protein n=1 Tax=Chroococcidiopsis sp. SAG 2025 TaxID=171389 RepID=UPI002936DBF8|nr:hypothetical protein [Chroococcidiopsis sp. SAG 2025]
MFAVSSPDVCSSLHLGVVHNGVAFPLLWWMLDQKGNSNTSERIELLEEFFEVFPTAEVDDLTADREFLGTDWFEYLLEQGMVEFRIRIRESDKLDNLQQSLKAKVVFSNLKPGQHQVLRHRRYCLGTLGLRRRIATRRWKISDCCDEPSSSSCHY